MPAQKSSLLAAFFMGEASDQEEFAQIAD